MPRLPSPAIFISEPSTIKLLTIHLDGDKLTLGPETIAAERNIVRAKQILFLPLHFYFNTGKHMQVNTSQTL